MTKDVTTEHADYAQSLTRWKLVEDAVAGEESVKAAGEAYLPRPNPGDKSPSNTTRYEQYKTRSVYYNATGRTVASLVGIAFRKWPEVDIPTQTEFLKEDVSGSGITLVQHTQSTLRQVLTTGRAGLLVDYPKTERQVSVAERSAGDIRSCIAYYPATAIVNWKTTRINGRVVLSMVVLKETYVEADGDFAEDQKIQYRVLKLTDGFYTVEIWRSTKDATGKLVWAVADAFSPLRGNGQRWTEIPFTFVGANNNDWNVDASPIYDIATVNMAHYRNSADYEDSVYLTGQPQFWIAGLTEEWRDHLEAQGVYVGSRSVLPLPVGGSCGILQATPNTLAKEAMTTKEAQMAALGARLLIANDSVKTATQVDSEDTASHSTLITACDNVSAGYKQCLTWCTVFENVGGTVEFSIGTEFVAQTLDATTLSALIAAVQAGKMPESDLWTAMRNAGLIDAEKDDDKIREEISSQPLPAAQGALDGGDSNQQVQ